MTLEELNAQKIIINDTLDSLYDERDRAEQAGDEKRMRKLDQELDKWEDDWRINHTQINVMRRAAGMSI